MTVRALLLAIIAGMGPMAHGHGDLHERIEALNAAIAAESNNGQLHLQRAELHRAHEDYPAALADYARAESLAGAQSAIDYGRGLTFAALKQDAEAVLSLTKCIEREPRHFDAYAARARVHGRRGEIGEAAADYDRAIALSPALEPDFVLERARVLAGANPPELDRAATGLREVLTAKGYLITIALELCEIEVRRKNFDEALAIVDRLRAGARRQEKWLMRRGEILATAGRGEEAGKAFEEALAAVEGLAPHLRGVAATRELEGMLRGKLRGMTKPE